MSDFQISVDLPVTLLGKLPYNGDNNQITRNLYEINTNQKKPDTIFLLFLEVLVGMCELSIEK